MQTPRRLRSVPDLDSAVAKLLAATDLTPDLTIDAGRWQLYRAASDDQANHETLIQIATEEPDRPLAAALVVHMLGLTPASDHPTWLATLAPSERAFATQRSTELSLLRTPPSYEALTRDLDSYTNWLQLGLAESLTDKPSLHELATNGRTKRIRNLAKARAKALLD